MLSVDPSMEPSCYILPHGLHSALLSGALLIFSATVPADRQRHRRRGGGMRFDGPAGPPPADGSCPFCDPATVATALATSDHFYLLADNAPLVEGHALIIPRDHYACFGALPVGWDGELLTLKGRVARFERERYRPAIFF